MFAAAFVAAHHALDILSVLVALAAERDQRAAGLRADRARRGALLRLLELVVASAVAAARRVAPRRCHQRHASRESAEIMVVPAAATAGQRVRWHTVRHHL